MDRRAGTAGASRLGAGAKLVVSATVLLVAMVALPGGRDAAAATQPGSVSCTQVTGTARFAPPLTTAGSASEVATLALLIKGCLAGGGGSSPKVGHGSGELPMTSNACTSLSSGSKSTLSIAVSWRPTGDGTSEATFPGYSVSTTDGLGLSLGGRHTSSTGSYAGTDAGASSTATLALALTLSQVQSACGLKNGLKMLKIGAGVLTLK